MLLGLVLLTLLLAAANGANDISKGIATLVGSGVASPRLAVLWGVITTAAGGIVALFATQGLVRTFSGKGIIHVEGGLAPTFFLAVACGAVMWLMVATWTGLPVSTTHSLFGALVGAAMAGGDTRSVLWTAAVAKIALPLLVSPLLALLLVVVAYPAARRAFLSVNRYCICIEETTCAPTSVNAGSIALSGMSGEAVAFGSAESECASSVARLNAMDALHWLSAGATSFFRGMNDTPKILAIGLAATTTGALSTTSLYALVAVAMAAGGAFAGIRVIRTLSERVTPIDNEGGLAANAVTSLLVGLASRWALPVSTTHVSTGAIVGNGLSRGKRDMQWGVLGGILLAWLVTLPASGAFAAATIHVIEWLA